MNSISEFLQNIIEKHLDILLYWFSQYIYELLLRCFPKHPLVGLNELLNFGPLEAACQDYHKQNALGCWAALRQVFPKTEEQRCWVHKIANVLDKLPKRLQPRAKSHLHEIMRTPDKATALAEMACFQEEYQAKYPKAVNCLLKDQETLFTMD